MGRVLKFATLLLLMAVSARAFTVPVLSWAGAHEQPAGCHEHGQGAPRHPASYTCCLAGHDSAIQLTSFTPKLPLTVAPGAVHSTSIVHLLYDRPRQFLLVSSGDPPGTSPLRI